MTCRELIESYLEWKNSASANEHTVRSYRKDLSKLLDDIGWETPVEEFDRFALHTFMAKLGGGVFSSASVRHVLACIPGLGEVGMQRENLQGEFRFVHQVSAETQNTTCRAHGGGSEDSS